MLTIAWLFISAFLGLFQLFLAFQPEWIVNRNNVQGLWLICNSNKCHVRRSIFTLLIIAVYTTGILLLLLSTVFALSILAGPSTKRKSLALIANTQFAAGWYFFLLLMGLSICCIPLAMDDIQCTGSMLLHSTQCRIGWAYASACVLSLISVCCPVLARLVADRNKHYYILNTEQLL